MAEPIATVYAVFASPAEAEHIGRAMVEAGHAACVNILAPCRSIYRWQGAIETATETPALFKTRAELAPLLAAKIAEMHSYDVPAITVWPVDFTPDSYADWVGAETPG